jgi:hypothetical protein
MTETVFLIGQDISKLTGYWSTIPDKKTIFSYQLCTRAPSVSYPTGTGFFQG